MGAPLKKSASGVLGPLSSSGTPCTLQTPKLPRPCPRKGPSWRHRVGGMSQWNFLNRPPAYDDSWNWSDGISALKILIYSTATESFRARRGFFRFSLSMGIEADGAAIRIAGSFNTLGIGPSLRGRFGAKRKKNSPRQGMHKPLEWGRVPLPKQVERIVL